MRPENSPSGGSARSSTQKSDEEVTAPQREYEDRKLSTDERRAASDEPDVLLDEAVVGNASDLGSEEEHTDDG